MSGLDVRRATKMQSVADIIDCIEQNWDLDDYEIHFAAQPVTRYDGLKTGLVTAVVRCDSKEFGRAIPVESSVGFFACLRDGTPLPELPIADLNGAVAKSDGSVLLASNNASPAGLHIKSVRFLPAPFHYDFSEIEHAVIQYALQRLDLYDFCNREVSPSWLPGVKWLDYSCVAQVRMSSLKERVISSVEKKLNDVLASDRLTPAMQAEYKSWKAGRSVRSAIERTLKQSGLQDA